MGSREQFEEGAEDLNMGGCSECDGYESRRKVLELAEKLGAQVTIQDFGDDIEVMIDAPVGEVWAYGGAVLHCLVANRYGGRVGPMWADLLERMEYGLADCPDGGLDGCELCATGGVLP